MRRHLALRKETLVELHADDLSAVNGAADAATTPAGACVVSVLSKVVECDSTLRPCISHGCTR